MATTAVPPAPVEPIDPQKIDDALKSIIATRIDDEVDAEKQKAMFRLEKADRYNKGQQHIYPKYEAQSGRIHWAALGDGDREAERAGVRDYTIDITKTYGRKYQAVMGSRPFYNATCVPERPNREEDRKAARAGGLLTRWLADRWKVQTESFRYFWKQWVSGTVYGFLTWEADGDLFGMHTEPRVEPKIIQIEPGGYHCIHCGAQFPEPDTSVGDITEDGTIHPQSVCPQCGVPVADYQYREEVTAVVPSVVGSITYEIPGPKLHLLDSSFVTVPPDCTDIRKAQYVLYEYEEHQGVLLAKYGEDLRKKMKDSGSSWSKTAGRRRAESARAQGASIDAAARPGKKNRWTYSRYWLKPENFEYVEDEMVRNDLKANYPRGCKIVMVDGTIVEKVNEDLADCWVAGQIEPGSTLYNDPLCYTILGAQDIVNDFWNLIIAVVERVMPSFVFDPDILSREALNDTAYQPGDGIPAVPGASGRLAGAIEKFPSASFPDQATNIIPGIIGHVEAHLGLLPVVYGGGEKSSTAEESRNRLNQAIQQLSVAGALAQQFWTDAYYLAIRMIAEKSPVPMEISTGKGKDASVQAIDPEELRAGRIRIIGHPGVPMSWAERRDQLNQIITQNPEMAQQLGLLLAENAPVVKDYLLTGMDDLQLPDDNAWQKTLDTIQLLLSQEPVEMNGRLMPSFEPEPFVVQPGPEADRILAWLVSPPGRELGKKKTPGYQNVVAYGMLCAELAAPPPPAPPPEGEAQQPPPPGELAEPKQQP